ncbi:hypothetical protein BDQ12DRAFT_701562 [Crucibulum laeve]|uniref:Uncharacterized protein n=1 Tax=Crucibulum laeve TaxID=68775 RepID=A0A5C3LHS2_9AGAR|nr:hypothetical protein BDQ12DRAFT_701562 [Crucibulum laeve]
MRECGTPNVPTFSALRKLQSQLTREVGIKTEPHTSALGNQFYMNHPLDLLALDWANPLVRKHIQVYPEVTSVIKEVWQADKWLKELDNNQLSPMWANWKDDPHRHFYVNELAQLKDGSFVIPIRWVIYQKQEHAEVYRVHHSESRIFDVESHEISCIPAIELHHNFRDLQSVGYNFEFTDPNNICSWKDFMPNPIRKVAKDRPVFCLRFMAWCDDVSGNVSKQYNAHMNMYITNANLPHQNLSQEYFVRFCSTSPHTTSLEQFDAMVKDVGKWKEAYDCFLETEILFQIFVHGLPADNPQQAESSSGASLNSSANCRYDTAGGTKEYKETNEGYNSLFNTGTPRTPFSTVQIIEEQIQVACLGVQDAVQIIQTCTGTKDKIAQFWIDKLIPMAREKQKLRFQALTSDAHLNNPKLKGAELDAAKLAIKKEIQVDLMAWLVKQPPDRYALLPEDSDHRFQLRPGDHYNSLMDVIGLNPHLDSPCEILHTYLLGIDKYIWHDTTKDWDKKKEELFAARLQSSSMLGLTLPPLQSRYIVQYKNSLIGKHFKAIQQLAVFHFDDSLCNPAVMDIWKATGELGAMLWIPEIRDLKQYLADLEILIANVLDVWAVHDPARIILKFKLHVLPHILDDIRRFGPAVRFSTEVFECWNAIFRLCSILSNHQAPSHDIGVTIADMERFKHMVSGGSWKVGGIYIQAGPCVRNFLSQNTELQHRLGWVENDLASIKPGSLKLKSLQKRNSLSWTAILQTLQSRQANTQLTEPGNIQGSIWNECKYVVSKARDICTEGSWVFCKDTMNPELACTARIYKILSPSTSKITSDGNGVVILEKFVILNSKDEHMNMPVLLRTDIQFIYALPMDIQFIFNAQHDCLGKKCPVIENATSVRQERNITSKFIPGVIHTDDTRFFVNMHALHNAHLLRESLPRHLVAPVPYFQNRYEKHAEFAASLRITGPAKRATAQARAKETREQNKQKKSKNINT